jgi:histidinol-phosphate aminotransferase
VGLAGLRLGLLVGRPQWLAQLDKIRLPYNINVLTQLSAEFSLRHHDELTTQAQQICDDRAYLYKALRALPTLQVYPSQANFILFRVAAGRGDEIFQGLKQAGILIKNLSSAGGALEDCLRVTVGRPEENQAFLDALQRLL